MYGLAKLANLQTNLESEDEQQMNDWQDYFGTGNVLDDLRAKIRRPRGVDKVASDNEGPALTDFARESAIEFAPDWALAGLKMGSAVFMAEELLPRAIQAFLSEDVKTFNEILKKVAPASKQEFIELIKKALKTAGKSTLLMAGTGALLGTANTYIPYKAHQLEQEKVASFNEEEERTTKGIGATSGAMAGGGLASLVATGRVNVKDIVSPTIQQAIDAAVQNADGDLHVPKKAKAGLIGAGLGLGALGGYAVGNGVAEASDWYRNHVERPSKDVRDRLLSEYDMEESIDGVDRHEIIPEVRGAIIGGMVGASPLGFNALKNLRRGFWKFDSPNKLGKSVIEALGRNALNPELKKKLEYTMPIASAGIGALAGHMTKEEK